VPFVKQTDPDFRIKPLNGSDQCITNPSNIPTSEEGIELYFQHIVVADGIRGKINGIIARTRGERKDFSTPYRKYLNQHTVYVSPAVLGLVDMLQTDHQLTFRDDIKASIMDIMSDNTPLSVFAKRVRELTPSTDNPRFANGIAIQVAIKDSKETEVHTENLAKAIEFVNKNGNHPVLSHCVFVQFGYGAAIDQNTFCSFICMQNKFMHNIKHVKIHGLSDIDIELHLENDCDNGEDYSNITRELLLNKLGIDGHQIFHSIEHTMKADTTRALFSKQNEILCNTILSGLDT
jgi:hypothetical protein